MKSNFRLWGESFLLGVFIILISIGYLFAQTGKFTIYTLEKSLAFSAISMIDLSFLVSGTSYFWKIGRSKMGYRKMVGVIGFITSLFHATIASYIFSGSYLWIDYIRINPTATFPAIIAILILTMMVAVSNWGIPKRIGAIVWRRLLRVGYIAILSIVIHETLLSYTSWILWIQTRRQLLPPLSLFSLMLSIATIGLRIALFFALLKKRKSAKQVFVKK